MTLTFLKLAVPAIAAAVILAQPVFGEEGDVVSIPEDDGTIQQCAANQAVPRLPETWKATALLTPFDAKELLIAQVQAVPDIMRVTTKGLESGARDDFLVAGDTTYRLVADGAGKASCVPVWKEEWVAPSPELLWGKGCSCEGIGSVTGVEAEAWKCPVPKEPASGPDHRRATAAEELFDWYWFTTPDDPDDPADREPLRILTSREVNNYRIPVLGDAALANLATVERPLDPGAAGTLRDLAAACEVDKRVPVAVPDPQIEGVDFKCQGFMPPTWPETVYSDGALYAIGGDYTRIKIYYEYDKLREVSKIYYQDGSIVDTYLTEDTAWEILWPSADAEPQCQVGLKNVGIWHRDWAARDGCSCKAAIAPHTQRLNPTDETVHAMSCFFGGTAYIQSWYSKSGRPHLFYETNAVDLDLIDYSEWIPNDDIPPEVFDREPTYCMTPSRTRVKIDEPFCADCHGGQIGYD